MLPQGVPTSGSRRPCSWAGIPAWDARRSSVPAVSPASSIPGVWEPGPSQTRLTVTEGDSSMRWAKTASSWAVKSENPSM